MDREIEKTNYYALAVAIFGNCCPEIAYAKLEGDMLPGNTKGVLSEDDARDMVLMRKEGLTYREIAEIYGLTIDAAYSWIRRQKAKQKG